MSCWATPNTGVGNRKRIQIRYSPWVDFSKISSAPPPSPLLISFWDERIAVIHDEIYKRMHSYFLVIRVSDSEEIKARWSSLNRIFWICFQDTLNFPSGMTWHEALANSTWILTLRFIVYPSIIQQTWSIINWLWIKPVSYLITWNKARNQSTLQESICFEFELELFQ